MEYSHIEHILDAKERIGADPRQRLAWAVTFAQEDLPKLPPGRLADLQVEMTAFLPQDIAARPGQHPLVSREDMRDIQSQFARVIKQVLRQEPITIGPYPIEISIFWLDGVSYYTTSIRLEDLAAWQRALHVFGTLLESGRDFIKECPAPKGRKATPCGRWFVGRSDQVYCSTRCQVRAGTRLSRQRASSTAARTKRTPRKEEL